MAIRNLILAGLATLAVWGTVAAALAGAARAGEGPASPRAASDWRPSVVDPLWPPLPSPGPEDWLAHFAERGQTFGEYVKSRPVRPTPERRTVYLQPLTGRASLDLDLSRVVAGHTRIYFGCPATILPPISPPAGSLRTRERGLRQHDGDALLDWLKPRLPADGLALAALTADDLFSGDLDFVFGLAWSGDRVMIHSSARYHEPGPGGRSRLLRRTLQTAAHELGHVLGIEHCVFYRCCMNGSNTLDESDRTPLAMCPEDLRKLEWACGLDVAARHRGLAKFYESVGLDQEARLVKEQISRRRGR